MKICVLASGSKGNSSYIETDSKKILVDLGMSCAYIERSLRSLGTEPSDIQAVFLTHTHTDHTQGLRVFLKKYNTKVYLTRKMLDELDFDINNYSYIEDTLVLDDLSVMPIKTSHDVADSNGYVFSSNDKSIVYITDTGYINSRNFNKLRDRDLYVFESNHDVRMLREGRYPYHLQQRILGDRGHLSNKDSAYYLSEFITDRTKEVVLIHLSEENNNPDVALDTLVSTLNKKHVKVPKLLIAKQKERTELIEV